MERGIVSAIDGRRARVKRPDGYVTGWLFMANSVVNIAVGDVVFYAPFGNDGVILHAIPDEAGGFAPLSMGVTNGNAHDHNGGDGAQIAYGSLSGLPLLNFLPLSGGTLSGDLNVGGYALRNYVAITSSNGNTYETYPLGLSYSIIDGNNVAQSVGDSFPAYGTMFNCKYNTSRFSQTLYKHSSNEVYYRTYYLGTWQAWTRIYDSTYAPFLPLSGGKLTGSLQFNVNNDFKIYSADGYIYMSDGVASSTIRFYPNTGEIRVNNNVVWHAGNDGAASGCDADLLDGQHGSYYLPVSSYSASDVLSKLLTVDGSGSGLDADLYKGKTLLNLLWSGSWSSGDITVTDFDKYTLFIVRASGNAARMLVVRAGGAFRGGTIYGLTDTVGYTIQLGATYSGTTLTFGYCNKFNHTASSSHGAMSNDTVSEIWGVI